MPAPTPALLALPDDAARALVAFLDRVSLEHVASVSRVASRNSCFQTIRDARSSSLTLPPTNDDDQCRRLVHGMHRRRPQRLASLEWIDVLAPGQVKLLLEDPAIAIGLQNVRVRTTDARDTATATQICETLCGLPNLRKLDLASTPLEDVVAIARMAQLHELDLSRTPLTDVSPLALLTELRVLVLEEMRVTDLRSVERLHRLEVLNVSQDRTWKCTGVPPVFVPSLAPFTRLHTLSLERCTVESTADLFHIAPSLRHIVLIEVRVRHRVRAARSRDVELAERLQRLESIHVDLGPTQNVFGPTTSILAKIQSLRVIHQSINQDLQALAPLVNVEEITLLLPEGDDSSCFTRGPEDYGVLLRLPQLKKVTIHQTTQLPWHWGPDVEPRHDALVKAHATALASVLMQMPKLTSLDYSGYIPHDAFLPGMKYLQHLCLHDCAPAIPPLDWLRSFSLLRSLDLSLPSSTDFSAIGDLVQLESLRFRFTSTLHSSTAPRSGQQFLTGLLNLRSLQMEYLQDVEYLRGMTKLETIIIGYLPPASSAAWSSLTSLRSITTHSKDLSFLKGLPQLREVAIHATADCRPLVANDRPPRLLRVIHPDRNCMPHCHHREVLDRREQQSRDAVHDSDEEKGSAVFRATTTEDY